MRALGIAMLAAPFVGLFVWAAREVGLLTTIGMFAAVVLISAWVLFAASLVV